MLRRLGVASLGVLALSGAANAADIYVPGPGGYKDAPCCAPVWTGFYAGANGGYGLSEFRDQLAGPNANVAGVRPEGAFGGGQIGYNWQGLKGYSPLVLGIEADIQWSDIKDKEFKLGFPNPSLSDLDWFGTVRGRIGYALDGALIYGTGGFAYGGIHNRVQFPLAGANGIFDFNNTATGYVAGGGLEYKVTPSWSVKTEYLFVNLGVNEPFNAATGFFYSKNNPGNKVNDDAFNVVRVGLNYHIGYSYEPLK